ncbi:MAG: hypothetical protein HOO67_05330 [Candidatus Peribacteraceae bacterium]|nr:hypothetical protein [Candidatus Peribacteraceae bacterium]
MHSWFHSPVLRRVVLVLLSCVALIALWKFIALLRHETLGSYYQDVDIYLALGRGMLNGLTPYIDLFETKPPGIFLLSALSLHLFNGAALILWTETILLALLPVIILVAVMRMDRRIMTMVIAAIFTIFLALYTGEAGGQGLAESFGAVFAVAVVMLAARYPQRFTIPVIILTAFLIFLAVFFKEPFLLSIIGGALIVSPSFSSSQRMLPSLVIAGVLFFIGLFLAGVFAPYFSVYLSHMIGHQMTTPWGVVPDPLWLRTIQIPRLWAALFSFSGFFPIVIFSVWLAALPLMVFRTSTGTSRLLAALQWLLGSWLLTLSIGISGDFYGHHFVFGVPVFAAFFLLCLREQERLLHTFTGKVITALWVAVLCVGILLKPAASVTADPQWLARDQERRNVAQVIDTTLAGCDVDRYLLLINANDGIQGYTTHSPLGPLFTQYARMISGRPEFLEIFGRQFHTAPIAIDKDDEPRPLLDEESAHEFQTAFTDVPPPCAGKDFVQPVPYRVLFRMGYFP